MQPGNLKILASNKHTGWKHYHLAILGDKYFAYINMKDLNT